MRSKRNSERDEQLEIRSRAVTKPIRKAIVRTKSRRKTKPMPSIMAPPAVPAPAIDSAYVEGLILRMKTARDVMSKERDALRMLLEEVTEQLSSADDGIEKLDEAIDTFSQLL